MVAGGHAWLPRGMCGCWGACMVAGEACVVARGACVVAGGAVCVVSSGGIFTNLLFLLDPSHGR